MRLLITSSAHIALLFFGAAFVQAVQPAAVPTPDPAPAADATKTFLVPFKIAGGRMVKCPCTEGGPLPAESGLYAMINAGPLVIKDPSGKTGKGMSLVFFFLLRVRENAKPIHIVVEDVSGDPARLVLDDKNPTIKQQTWAGLVGLAKKGEKIGEGSTAWMYEKKPTIIVYRVTISAKDTQDVVLYQPVWLSLESKSKFISSLRLLGAAH